MFYYSKWDLCLLSTIVNTRRGHTSSIHRQSFKHLGIRKSVQPVCSPWGESLVINTQTSSDCLKNPGLGYYRRQTHTNQSTFGKAGIVSPSLVSSLCSDWHLWPCGGKVKWKVKTERGTDKMLAQNGNHLRYNWDARTSAGVVLFKLKGHVKHLAIVLNSRLWFNRPGVGSEILQV